MKMAPPVPLFSLPLAEQFVKLVFERLNNAPAPKYVAPSKKKKNKYIK
jgi:hypothetical protein